jgi:hypothetical protein
VTRWAAILGFEDLWRGLLEHLAAEHDDRGR